MTLATIEITLPTSTYSWNQQHVYTYIFLPYHSRGQGQKSNILETGEQCVQSSNGRTCFENAGSVISTFIKDWTKGGILDSNIEANIHPPSYPHMVGNIFDAAERIGFEILGDIKEVRIDNEEAEQLGRRVRKRSQSLVWFRGCFRKKRMATPVTVQ
ncbi:conserved hypothetical protein [Histoplasma capsulatum var. duboisii H88]|uniref:Uncharacterized protein n=1 Tax=Ajellomyces capsulatus (strain H88) TaxID=544711 RepID=F0UST5_AJEC8|nr:conserved hypothetical protein [Histoplasma capsulatum var. duboisii H88]